MYRKCNVIYNNDLGNDYVRLCFDLGTHTVQFQPGQFVMLKAWQGNDPFLMRPFSINSFNADNNTVEIVYHCVGKGTELMRSLKAQDGIEILGPLGQGFTLKESYKSIALIGRGVGAAPLRFLAEQALRQGITPYIFLSARSSEMLFDRNIYDAMGIDVYTSINPQELVTDKLRDLIEIVKIDAAYTCGSKRLMQELQQICKQYAIEGYVSLEEHMACGVGACLGCVCNIAAEPGLNKEVRVCKEGPVFDIERVVANQN